MDKEDEHSPSEFYYPKDLETFDVETETGITEWHIINTFPVLGNIAWPSAVAVRPRFAGAVLPRPRADIPQYGPRARLVSS